MTDVVYVRTATGKVVANVRERYLAPLSSGHDSPAPGALYCPCQSEHCPLLRAAVEAGTTVDPAAAAAFVLPRAARHVAVLDVGLAACTPFLDALAQQRRGRAPDALAALVLLQSVLASRVPAPRQAALLRSLVTAPCRASCGTRGVVYAGAAALLHNRFLRELAVPRAPGEPLLAHVRRTEARAARWLAQHWRGAATVALVCATPSDANAVRAALIAEEQVPEGSSDISGVDVCSLGEYVERYVAEDSEDHALFATLAQTLEAEAEAEKETGTGTNGTNGSIFAPYWQEKELVEGVRSGRVVRGKYRAHNYESGCVQVDATHGFTTVELRDAASSNRAIDGDVCFVEVLSSATETEGAVTGRVVGIVRRNWRPYVAALETSVDNESSESSEEGDSRVEQAQPSSSRATHVFVVPYDRRVPKVRVRLSAEAEAACSGARLVVSVDAWDAGARHPDGHVVRVLGAIGELQTEVDTVLVENEISCPPFTAALLASLPPSTPQAPWRVPAAEAARRRDLRGLRVYSIDPPGCRDIDDALSVCRCRRPVDAATGAVDAVRLDDAAAARDCAYYCVGVHIADPSFFVTEGSLLDREARRRSTTVYLPHTRFPMLPPALSEGICSLFEGQDRLAVSVLFTLDARTLDIVGPQWYGRTVVRSCHAMSYSQAQAILDWSGDDDGGENSDNSGNDSSDDKNTRAEVAQFKDRKLLRQELEVLLRVSQRLRAERVARGGLELASDEVSFNLDTTTALPTAVRPHDELPANDLVAEFMLLANESVARRLRAAFPASALLRAHAHPASARFAQLERVARAAGVDVRTATNRALAESLNAAARADPVAGAVLKTLATRAMAEAQYICAGAHPVPDHYHYGLGSAAYTHFTSPIRRYADIVVHRQLLAAVNDPAKDSTTSVTAAADTTPEVSSSSSSFTQGTVDVMADHMNRRNHAARRAQKDAMLLFQAFYFHSHDRTSEAVVYTVARDRLLVHVPQYALKTTVYLLDAHGASALRVPGTDALLPADQIRVDCDRQTVALGAPLNVRIRLFDRLVVRLVGTLRRTRRPDLRATIVAFTTSSSVDAAAATSPVSRSALVGAVFGQRTETIRAEQQAAVAVTETKSEDESEQEDDEEEEAASTELPWSETDQTVRRWAMTLEQLHALEVERSPEVAEPLRVRDPSVVPRQTRPSAPYTTNAVVLRRAPTTPDALPVLTPELVLQATVGNAKHAPSIAASAASAAPSATQAQTRTGPRFKYKQNVKPAAPPKTTSTTATAPATATTAAGTPGTTTATAARPKFRYKKNVQP